MNPLQQASVRRKVYYFAAILGLFTLSMFWRGTIPIPLAGKSGAATWISSKSILSQATRFELRELDQGDPEIAGTSARLLMTGSRGFVVSSLWLSAIEKQKRNDFHDFEILVRAITKLQPNFITPWIFQSWNIAYNVSVEMHSIGDMYFYISRGISLLAEGERRNTYRHTDADTGEERRIGSPDMRYQIAFYYQNKFGVSDQVQTLRCLMQLSCIPRDERDPKKLMKGDQVDLDKFQQFCERHPQLVRRLRGRERLEETSEKNKEKLQNRTPADVVQFLKDNNSVPDRFKGATELADPTEQFPIFPPKFNEGPEEVNPSSTLGDDFSAFRAARAWFSYSLVLLPPNPSFPLDEGGEPMPAATPLPGEYDPFKYRVPRSPMLIIFRQGAPRAQSFQAEMYQKDGWFDESGWEIDARVDSANQWFPGKTVIVGQNQPQNSSRTEYEKAAALWREHGRRNGLSLDADVLRRLDEIVRGPNQPPSRSSMMPQDPTPEQVKDKSFMRRYRAQLALHYYQTNRQVTNFAFYLASSETEAKPEAVLARKTLWQADQARRVANRNEAMAKYQLGLDLWKKLLIANPSFHRMEMFSKIEEDTYEYELDYIRLLLRMSPPELEAEANKLGLGYQAVIPFLPKPFPDGGKQWHADVLEGLKWDAAEMTISPFAGGVPADAVTPWRGTPWTRPEFKDIVRNRQGVRVTPTDTGPAPVGPGGGGN